LVSLTDAIKARNKQAAKEKLYISLLYLNPDKHTIVVSKQQMIFAELTCG